MLPSPNKKDPDAASASPTSPDFRAHSVSFFFEPIPAHHDRAASKCASTRTPKKAATSPCASSLPGPSGANPQAPHRQRPARARRRDRVDIVVDLSGITIGHRCRALAQPPRPVQITYLGYPNTTGLPAMDYRIVDAVTDPPAMNGK